MMPPTMHCGVRADPGKPIEQYRETPQPVARPLVAGYYWCRQIITQKSTKRIKRPDIVCAWWIAHIVRQHESDETSPLIVEWESDSELLTDYISRTPKLARYEWVGPIPEPSP